MSKKDKQQSSQNFRPKEVVLVYTENSLAFILIKHGTNFRTYLPKETSACSAAVYLFEMLGMDDLDVDVCFGDEGLQKLVDALTPVDFPYEIPKHLGWYNLKPGFSTFSYEYSGFPLKLKLSDGSEMDTTLIWGLILPQTVESESLIYLRSRITDSAGDATYEIMPNYSINSDEFGMVGASIFSMNAAKETNKDLGYNFRLPGCFARTIDNACTDGYYFTRGNILHFLSFLEYFKEIK